MSDFRNKSHYITLNKIYSRSKTSMETAFRLWVFIGYLFLLFAYIFNRIEMQMVNWTWNWLNDAVFFRKTQYFLSQRLFPLFPPFPPFFLLFPPFSPFFLLFPPFSSFFLLFPPFFLSACMVFCSVCVLIVRHDNIIFCSDGNYLCFALVLPPVCTVPISPITGSFIWNEIIAIDHQFRRATLPSHSSNERKTVRFNSLVLFFYCYSTLDHGHPRLHLIATIRFKLPRVRNEK